MDADAAAVIEAAAAAAAAAPVAVAPLPGITNAPKSSWDRRALGFQILFWELG